jgi:hypothetical protein
LRVHLDDAEDVLFLFVLDEVHDFLVFVPGRCFGLWAAVVEVEFVLDDDQLVVSNEFVVFD